VKINIGNNSLCLYDGTEMAQQAPLTLEEAFSRAMSNILPLRVSQDRCQRCGAIKRRNSYLQADFLPQANRATHNERLRMLCPGVISPIRAGVGYELVTQLWDRQWTTVAGRPFDFGPGRRT